MQTYRITPHDLLFFRDGRPLDRNKQDADHRNIGHGAFWPRPDHLFHAVLHALVGSRTIGGHAAYGQFGGLQTVGPFPLRKNKDGTETFFLPRPLDWDCVLEEMPEAGIGKTDAPAFLHHGIIDREEGKKNYPAWISDKDYKAYLEDDLSCESLKGYRFCNHDENDGPLFLAETRVGNTLDHDTGASKRFRDKSRSGQYEAQYLRLGKRVAMWVAADTGSEDSEIPLDFVMGGQNLLVSCQPDDSLPKIHTRFPIPSAPPGSGPFFVRWTLLVPALFEQTGWRPGWVDSSDGRVRLKEKELTRGENEPRSEWKARQESVPEIAGVHLDAACIGKPLVFSGFDAIEGVKPTRLAVPAGSCYVFLCDTESAANALVGQLHLKRKSDFGPQGFGIGVCSFVKTHTRKS